MDEQAMTVRLPKELYERLRQAAFDMRAPMSVIIIEAIDEHLTGLERAAEE